MLKKSLMMMSVLALAIFMVGCGKGESTAEQGPQAEAGTTPSGDGPKQGTGAGGPGAATMEPNDAAKNVDNIVGSKAGGGK